ncbi:MAG TPA: Xaa-Pro peptidase family protein [Bacteroidota bacterium]|nr:Xaa-Pro peptidase family protein [Bacteroidota bacterium]
MQRLQALRTQLMEHRLDALIVSELTHVRYLTGFSGTNGLCVVTPTQHFFLTDHRYKTQAPAEIRNCKFIVASNGLFQEIVTRNLLARAHRIGVEAENISVLTLSMLRKLLHEKKIILTTSLIETLTEIKDKEEIGFIRQAVEFSDLVFAKILPLIKPGISEADIAAEISYWHRKFGADADAFEPIVASGGRGALPHARASAKKLKKGEFVVMDFGCQYRGYHSDITRTVAVGRPTSEMKTIYQIVLDAQQRAIDLAQEGVAACAVDAAARTYIKQQGYGKYFIHSLGHGLGLHVHDPLRLSAQSRSILQAGNVTTIEPGIYIPDSLGVRIEDDIVIRQNGCDVLNQSPKNLLVL